LSNFVFYYDSDEWKALKILRRSQGFRDLKLGERVKVMNEFAATVFEIPTRSFSPDAFDAFKILLGGKDLDGSQTRGR